MSVSLKSWTAKLTPDEISICDEAVKLAIDKSSNTDTKRKAVLDIMNFYINQIKTMDTGYVEYRTPEQQDIESFCELGFLKKLMDKKTSTRLWFCLKNQRPDGKGKVVLMADGLDRTSIKALCEACHQGALIHQQRKLGEKAIESIMRLGNEQVTAILFSCVHPHNDFIQIRVGGKGTFYCRKSDTRKSINRTCENSMCDSLNKIEVPIALGDTEQFKEFQKALEDKGND